MRLVVLGSDGMLGHKLCRELAEDHELFPVVRGLSNKPVTEYFFNEILKLDTKCIVDACNWDEVSRVLDECRPDYILNAVGFIKQRDGKNQEVRTVQLNCLIPHQLNQWCCENDARLIHFSTDCVFSGESGMYCEADRPDPIDFYGRTKLVGEVHSANALTIRTSIVGWELSRSTSLLEWFRANYHDNLSGYKKAIYSGLSTKALSECVSYLLDNYPDASGLYHVASEPISKYQLLSDLKAEMGWKGGAIQAEEDFTCDRSLDGSRFVEAFGWKTPSWEQMISQLAADRPFYDKMKQSV